MLVLPIYNCMCVQQTTQEVKGGQNKRGTSSRHCKPNQTKPMQPVPQ